MSERDKSARDSHDQALARALRAIRVAQPLPVSTTDEPSEEELLRYLEGTLRGGEHDSLERRIAKSPLALDRLAIVNEALRESGYPMPKLDPVGRRAVRYVFRLAQGTLTFLRGTELPSLPHAALALRGGSATHAPSLYEFEHAFDALRAQVTVERVASGFSLHIALQGNVPDGTRLTLRRDEKTIDSLPLDGGAGTFGPLASGHYRVEARKGDQLLAELHVDVLDA